MGSNVEIKVIPGKFGTSYWGGKTYLAGLLSFIPLGISKFRYEWSFGRVTAYGLFGLVDHRGLRGGAVMEAYLNFSWYGVVIFGLLQGVVYGILEKVFYCIFYNRKKLKYGGKEVLIAYMISSLHNFFVITSGAYNVYVDLLFLILVVFLSGLRVSNLQYSKT